VATGDKKNQHGHAIGDMLMRCKKQHSSALRANRLQQMSVEHLTETDWPVFERYNKPHQEIIHATVN